VALLEIGLALATDPKLLLLDEPICGMGPAETEQTVAKIQEISEHIDIIIIEHDIEVVFKIADRITVMANGAVLAQGGPKEISENIAVRTAYLGDEDDD
jgi:branched-chain amino acid transport system ATP-binding protein